MRVLRCLIVTGAFVLVGGCARVGIPPGPDVTKDDRPPRLAKVRAVDANHVEVRFSEPMDEKALADASHYAFDDEALTVNDVVVLGPDAVSLTTSSQRQGQEYALTVRNVKDAAGGNPIRQGNRAVFRGSGKEDDKPPAIVSTFPADGDEKVGLYPEVALTFSDVVAAAGAAVDLYDDLFALVPVKVRTEGNRVIVRPEGRLDYATRYELRPGSGIADVAGNPVVREGSFSFRTIEDYEEGVISGKVVAKEEGVSADGVEVRLTTAGDPLSKEGYVVSYAAAGPDGAFRLAGVPPNSESKASYYLVASVDEDDDGVVDLIGGYGFADGKGSSLPPFLGGERLENVEVTLTRSDREGPRVREIVVSPNPTRGQEEIYIRAVVADEEGSPVVAAEAFIDDVWSDGTGVALRPVEGGWGGGATATAEAWGVALGAFGVRGAGPHKVYVHARDRAGNWGPLAETVIDLSGPPPGRGRVAGGVIFERLPAVGAWVAAAPAGGDVPVAFARAAKDGAFLLKDLSAGRYDLYARYDEDEDGVWQGGEPAAFLAGVEVNAGEVTVPSLRLAYPPALTGANARFQRYGGREERGEFKIEVAVRDQDGDLEGVTAKLPDGREVELTDEGAPPDAAAGDGVYTWGETYRTDALTRFEGGEVSLRAKDAVGNVASAGPERYPGLKVTALPLPAGLDVGVNKDGVTVRWDKVAGADGGYVVFLVPAERWGRFSEPGTGEVYSNFANPTFDTTLSIPWTAIADWWGYPAGAEFVVMVVAGAGDSDDFARSDKVAVTATFVKPRAK